ncbi:MAG: sulfotransferase, partial [Acidiferrobacterales bacterium]
LESAVGGARPYPECAEDIDHDTATAVADEYETYLRRGVGGDILRVSDKMPANFHHLGFIAILFPKARIVHCLRDSLDTCLSNYFQNFAKGVEYAYDLSDIGAYYRQYERLMAHWRKVLPLSMYEIQYEELVADADRKTRELIDFLDLEWDERCLSFHRTRRPVQTVSSWQVRQPIYTRSVHRWRNYEKFLGPLKDSLGMD